MLFDGGHAGRVNRSDQAIPHWAPPAGTHVSVSFPESCQQCNLIGNQTAPPSVPAALLLLPRLLPLTVQEA